MSRSRRRKKAFRRKLSISLLVLGLLLSLVLLVVAARYVLKSAQAPSSAAETGTAAADEGAIPQLLPLPSAGEERERLNDSPPVSEADSAPEQNAELPDLPSLLGADPSVDYADKLQLSELMPKNKAALADPSGAFPDWAELENISDEPVSLKGWSLSDKVGLARWSFDEAELAPGERLVVFFNGRQGPDFSLSRDETLYLLSPDGELRDEALCVSDRADRSLIRQEDGSFAETAWISPGYENSSAGYDAWCLSRSAGESLVINEAAVFNRSYVVNGNWDYSDWVEIKNVSDQDVPLAGCSLSDKSGERRWLFPEDAVLVPGEILVISCHNDEEEGNIGTALNTGFDLSASGEQLFLRDADGVLLDYAALHDIPIGASMGRMDGQSGFFYFASPSPGHNNADGCRRVTEQPRPLEPDGAYDAVESVKVELLSPGEIHYTTDGSVPTLSSPRFEEPLFLTSTTVVRAVALEEGALVSPVATYTYFINEHHTLPLLSLVVDDLGSFNYIYNNGLKHRDLSSNLAFYDGEHSFNHACDVSMKGYTSLNELPKKSMGVSFKGRYGGNLECNVFDNGITEFGSLAIRGGQDYTFSVFRNELFQRLCEEASDVCLTQSSKFCILYINGKYYGIYCLKEDFSKQYFASHAGVSVGSVVANKCPVSLDSEFYNEVLKFIYHNDLTTEENYQYVREHVDLDSLIDWFILEGYSANTDIQGNTRMYRSPENGNRWVFCYYDLDWGFYYSKSDFTIIMQEIGNAGNQMPPLVKNLLKNRYFRDDVLYRFAELNRTTLSNEHVLALIDEYEALLKPEIPRDRQRWGLRTEDWQYRVNELRNFIINNNWEVHNIDNLCYFLHVGEMERQQIFGR